MTTPAHVHTSQSSAPGGDLRTDALAAWLRALANAEALPAHARDENRPQGHPQYYLRGAAQRLEDLDVAADRFNQLAEQVRQTARAIDVWRGRLEAYHAATAGDMGEHAKTLYAILGRFGR